MRNANGGREGQHTGRRRPGRQAPRVSRGARRSRRESRSRELGRRGAARAARARLRRDRARRQHAGHRRHRDGRADPQARPHVAYADHLRHGLRRRNADGARLQARRRRLHLDARRARDLAEQGARVRRSVSRAAARGEGCARRGGPCDRRSGAAQLGSHRAREPRARSVVESRVEHGAVARGARADGRRLRLVGRASG